MLSLILSISPINLIDEIGVRMKVLSLVMLAVLLGACSSKKMVNVQGVKRIDLKQQKYQKPQFYVKNYTPSKVRSRKIASTSKNFFNHLSLKRIYFLTLWQQQKVFSTLLNKAKAKANDKMFCPQFHNDLLNYENNLAKTDNYYSIKFDFNKLKEDPKSVISHPVMSLPYKGVDLYSYLSHTKSWSNSEYHARKALEQHYKINKKEVEDLCINGASDGLYVFQNMSKYYSDDKEFQSSSQVLSSILKVGPITNMFILDELSKPEHKNIHITEIQNALLEKLNVVWFKNYLYEMTSMRNNDLNSFVLKE